jgi:hypothetical protein
VPRKRRTRQHVIADLSANYVERQALRAGYSVERSQHDYGIDLTIYTYDANGEVQNGQIVVQVKATERLRVLADGQTIAFAVARSDLEFWLHEPMPVILIVYDAREDVAYWLYLQAYFEERAEFRLSAAGHTVMVHLPKANVLDEAAVRQFARWRDDVLRQTRGAIRHHG